MLILILLYFSPAYDISSRVKKKCSELHQSFPALPLASLLYTLLFLSWYLQDSSNEASKNLCFPIYVFPGKETYAVNYATMLWQQVPQGYAQSINKLVFLLKYQSPTASAIVLLCICGESRANHVSWDSLWQ